MPSKLSTLLTTAVLAVGAASVANGAVIIDQFNGALNLNIPALGANPSVVAGGNTPGAGVVGGSRGAVLTRHVGNNAASLNIDLGGNSLLEMSSGPDDIASALLQYDGDTNPNSLNGTGLGSVDLTEGGANGMFSVLYRADLAGAPVTVTVYTDAGNASRASFNTAATGFGANPFVSGDLLFANFTTLLGAGANFANVGAIEIAINSATGVSGLDIQLDLADSRIVPEPAGLAALAGSLMLLARRRKA